MPMTDEERAAFKARLLKPLLKPKPKPALVAEVSDRLAEKARRNPRNVRVSVRDDADGTTLVERPRRDPRIVTINFRALDVNRRSNLTPDRRPILTPSGGAFWR